jgi:predicted GNAT family N-acyltransferase
MPLKIIDHGTPDYQRMVQLRNEILRKPLGLYFTEEELAREKDEILIGAFEDDKMLACCMLVRGSDRSMRLRQMAVINNLQGKGVGRAIMQFAENVARDLGSRKMTMHARVSAVGFYEKLGYQTVGDLFEEVTIPHVIMEKDL